MLPPLGAATLEGNLGYPHSTTQTKQCFPSVVLFILFASPAPSVPLSGVQSCLNLLVCVWERGRPLPWGCSRGGAGPRGGQVPCSMPRPPVLLCMSSMSRRLNTLPDLSLPPLCGPVALSVSVLFRFILGFFLL
uniref:Uncharacterized protein n=1 Tax=Molossus molossus TaxID=27622 RepID=A0A7J8EEJ1_MOLMO|nr:hypothetical protein HJG59_008812 [Molossus molossus]